MRLVWLPEAQSDIDRLYRFLEEKNPEAAIKAVRLIINAAERLLKLPELGHLMGDDTERREFYLPFGTSAYVLRYRLVPNEVVVIRVWHGRECRDEVSLIDDDRNN